MTMGQRSPGLKTTSTNSGNSNHKDLPKKEDITKKKISGK